MINLMKRTKAEARKDARLELKKFLSDFEYLWATIELVKVPKDIFGLRGYSVTYVTTLPDGKTQRRLPGPTYLMRR